MKRIILVRHGRPDLPADLEQAISGREIGRWYRRYDDLGIVDGVEPPAPLREAAAAAGCVVASDSRRALESVARLVGDGRADRVEPALREVGFPESLGVLVRLSPDVWVLIVPDAVSNNSTRQTQDFARPPFRRDMRPSSCLLAFVLAAGFLAAGARPAAACSCAGFQSPCQAFASSPIVFVGEVLSAERTGDDFHMRLRVVRALKGIREETADLWSNANTSCGIKLERGRAPCHLHVPGERPDVDPCLRLRPARPIRRTRS